MLTEIDNIGAPRRTVAPTLLPVTLDEVKEELDILDDNSIDARLIRLIQQAVDIVERDSRRQLMTQTWQLWFDSFPSGGVELRKGPVQSVTSVEYITNSVLTTWAVSNYETDLISEPARIIPSAGAYWPVTDGGVVNAVKLEWVAGYASASAVPPCAKAAVLYAVRQFYYGCELGDNYWTLIERLRTFGWV